MPGNPIWQRLLALRDEIVITWNISTVKNLWRAGCAQGTGL